MVCSVTRGNTYIASFHHTTPQWTLDLSAFNMTTRAWTLLTMIIFFVNANSVENIYSDNGWRPMSNEKVFALQRNFIKTPLQINNVAGNSMDNVYQRKAMKIVTPSVHLNEESIKAHEAIFSLRNEIERTEGAFEETKPTTTDITEEMFHEDNKLLRKAKNIAEPEVIIFSDNALRKTIQNDERKIKTEKRTIASSPNTYDVYENSEQDILITNKINLKPIKSIKSNGYKYETPKVDTIKKNNLTSNLFNILANYNIRTDDKLPNYALSLRQNSRNSNNKDFVYMHVPIKIPLKYNSPNHLPVDPLLAVFLSNYGHYLPGVYGFQRSYNNLYGYLASNNIHNNNPFGSYKIFSDSSR